MTITYDSSRHGELVSLLTRAADSIQAQLDSLETEAASLRAQWSGDARGAYDRAQRDWSAAMLRLGDGLRSSTKAAESAGARLAQADQDAAATWQ
jgi:WXG100 family type VII secretion target